jgi:bifunctional UDP-N-acetylglucosamine pyrophosphorylase/glucosamine-1-phosphate N-acetyltransferase
MIDNRNLATIVLAAGKGTRMKSARAKVLHEVFFQPMLHHVLNAAAPMHPKKSIVIVGHQREAVEQSLADYRVTCVEQKEQNGTGHAVLAAEAELSDFNGHVMILCGDSPLLLTKHLVEMYEHHVSSGARLTILTTCLDDPTNYGRVITSSDGRILGIVEEKDASEQQRALTEINGGIYCVEHAFLFEALKQLTPDNSQNELYLTDIVAIGVQQGIDVNRYEHPHPEQVLGVNSRYDLAQAHIEIQARRNRDLMVKGITMQHPASISVAPSVTIEQGCMLTQQVVLRGNTKIGPGCVIEPGAVIIDSELGSNVHVGANSVLDGCRIEDNEKIAPLKHVTVNR